jgi:nitroreductase
MSFITMSRPSTAYAADNYSVRELASHDAIGSLLAQRYGSARAPEPFAVNNTLEHILAHRSVRRFLPRPVSDRTLELLVAAAQSAPTSSNLQLWSVVTVSDPERRRELAKVAGGQSHVERSPLFLVWLADLHRISEIADRRGTSKDGIPYLETFLSAVVDTTLAAQNAVVAAESLGLGTVYIGAIRNQPNRVAEILSLPPNVLAIFGMCVGWPDPEIQTAIKPRLPQEVVLHRDVYRSLENHLRSLEVYDREVVEFQRRTKNSSQKSWTEKAAESIATVAALGGRHILRDELVVRGIGLE